MAGSIAPLVVFLLPMLRCSYGQGVTDTATHFGASAFSTFTSAFDKLSGGFDSALNTVTGYMDEAKALKGTAHGYVQTVNGHVTKAKSLKEEVMNTFCGMPFAIESMCKGYAKAPPSCTGIECCASSACYSNILPFLKCDSERGEATCIGASILGRAGTCMCTGGSCSTTGKCLAAVGTGLVQSNWDQLFEDEKVIPRESFTLTWLALVGLAVSLVAACAATTRRVRRSSRSISVVQAEALVDEAVE